MSEAAEIADILLEHATEEENTGWNSDRVAILQRIIRERNEFMLAAARCAARHYAKEADGNLEG